MNAGLLFVRLVLMRPELTVRTLTPRGFSSKCRISLAVVRAALEAAYVPVMFFKHYYQYYQQFLERKKKREKKKKKKNDHGVPI